MGKRPVRQLLAENLAAVMSRSLEYGTQKKLAVKADIAQTSVSQILNTDNEQMKSPKLSQVEKLAEPFGLEVWELLHPDCVAIYEAKIEARKNRTHERRARSRETAPA